MGIRENSKKIVQYYLDQVIKQGNLHTRFLVQFDVLANALSLESAEYCRVCCQYLLQKGCLKVFEESADARSIELHSSAIDFLEQDN